MNNFKKIEISVCVMASAIGGQANSATLNITSGTIFGQYYYSKENENPNFPSATIGVAHNPGQVGTWVMSNGNTLALTTPVKGGSLPSVLIGRGLGSNGKLEMSGTGTRLLVQGDQTGADFDFGVDKGVGIAIVRDGAEVIVTDRSGVPGSSASIHLGASDGIGSLTVSNANVEISGAEGAYIFLGAEDGAGSLGGKGSVLLNNGATMTIKALTKATAQIGTDGAVVDMGQANGSEASFQVTNGSTLRVEGERQYAGMNIAREEDTQGTFDVTKGGKVSIVANSLNDPNPTGNAAFVDIGVKQGAVGRLNIDGVGSEISLAGTSAFVSLGRFGGFGELNISNGGKLISNAALGEFSIGQLDPTTQNGGQGLVTVSGAGSRLDWGGSLALGNRSGLNSSEGTLIINSGGQVTANDGVTIYDGGTVKGNGGVLNANVTLNGGTISPGLSPGLLTINGDLNILRGSLDFEIASLTNFDILNILGATTASAPFNLNLLFIGGYKPNTGDSFNLFGSSALDASFGSFFNLSVFGLGSGQIASYDPRSGGGFTIAESIAPVPLPASLPLMLGALFLLGFLRKYLTKRSRYPTSQNFSAT